MKILIVSYSMTGNNEALASGIAGELAAERLRITEPRKRTMRKIAFDVIANRTPKIKENIDGIEENDLIIFVGPVWMGHVASPFRACLNHLKGKKCDYAFISISGGADGPNPDLEDDLTNRVGKTPEAVIDLHIADILPIEPKPTRKDTMNYRLNDNNARTLSDTALMAIRKELDLQPDRRKNNAEQERKVDAVSDANRRE